MAITISRTTGEIIAADPLTEEQKQALALAAFKAFTGLHPEAIQRAVEEYQRRLPQ